MNEAVRVFAEAIVWLHYNHHACRFISESAGTYAARRLPGDSVRESTHDTARARC
jgi:hypothetical protein